MAVLCAKLMPNGGEYVHFGIKHGIDELIGCGELSAEVKCVKLQFNIDGMPLFKSSGVCIWPILCTVLESSSREPFVVGVFCGVSKQPSMQAFLNDFVDECRDVVATGIVIGDHLLSVELNSFVCDAPARAMIKITSRRIGVTSAVTSAHRKASGVGKLFTQKPLPP